MASNKREKLFVRLAVDRRGLELSEPDATLDLLEAADARVRLDLDLDDGAWHFWSAHMGLTFDISGSRRQAKPAGGRPLDGEVRRHQ